MPYTIGKKGNKFCVYKKGTNGQSVGSSLGCHDTKQEAVDQIGAIESAEKYFSGDVKEMLTQQRWVYEDIIYALISVSRLDQASELIDKLDSLYTKARLSIELAQAYIRNLQREEGLAILRGVYGMVVYMQDGYDRLSILERLVYAYLGAGELDQAIETANAMSDIEMKEKTISKIDQFRSKSFVMFKEDDEGNMWFIGAYSNKFMDREGEIFSEQSHLDYAKWLDESGVKPPVVLFHQPKPPLGMWSTVLKAYSAGMISTEVMNKALESFYKKYAIGLTEKVFYNNGFTVTVAKVFEDRKQVVKNLQNMPYLLGMSHGFVPVSRSGNIFNKYYSFEFSILPLHKAANIWTFIDFAQEKSNMDKDVKDFLNQAMGEDVADELEEKTAAAQDQLENAGVDFKEEDAPETEEEKKEEVVVDPLFVNEVVKAMNLPEFVERIKQLFVEVSNRMETIENSVTDLKKEQDQQVSELYDVPLSKLFGESPLNPVKDPANVVEEDEGKKEVEIFDPVAEFFPNGKV